MILLKRALKNNFSIFLCPNDKTHKNKTLKFAKDELKKLLVLDYRLLAERFRSDQFTTKQMTEEFKANPEFKDWYFKNYWALEKWRSI